MKYIVVKPFVDLGVFKQPGDYVEADDTRAAKLRAMGLIGGQYEQSIERAVPMEPEIKQAIIKPKPLKKKRDKVRGGLNGYPG